MLFFIRHLASTTRRCSDEPGVGLAESFSPLNWESRWRQPRGGVSDTSSSRARIKRQRRHPIQSFRLFVAIPSCPLSGISLADRMAGLFGACGWSFPVGMDRRRETGWRGCTTAHTLSCICRIDAPCLTFGSIERGGYMSMRFVMLMRWSFVAVIISRWIALRWSD